MSDVIVKSPDQPKKPANLLVSIAAGVVAGVGTIIASLSGITERVERMEARVNDVSTRLEAEIRSLNGHLSRLTDRFDRLLDGRKVQP